MALILKGMALHLEVDVNNEEVKFVWANPIIGSTDSELLMRYEGGGQITLTANEKTAIDAIIQRVIQDEKTRLGINE